MLLFCEGSGKSQAADGGVRSTQSNSKAGGQGISRKQVPRLRIERPPDTHPPLGMTELSRAMEYT